MEGFGQVSNGCIIFKLFFLQAYRQNTIFCFSEYLPTGTDKLTNTHEQFWNGCCASRDRPRSHFNERAHVARQSQSTFVGFKKWKLAQKTYHRVGTTSASVATGDRRVERWLGKALRRRKTLIGFASLSCLTRTFVVSKMFVFVFCFFLKVPGAGGRRGIKKKAKVIVRTSLCNPLSAGWRCRSSMISKCDNGKLRRKN